MFYKGDKNFRSPKASNVYITSPCPCGEMLCDIFPYQTFNDDYLPK